jgi:squalene synthase HpnC
MSDISDFSSGKGHTDENFPVASVLIHPDLRAPILAFYRFVRAADDVADNATAKPKAKLDALEKMRLGLIGEGDGPPVAITLREELKARDLTNQHALDLLEAFRRDVTKLRYKDFADLLDYCRWSAMPVGRFVLDVHGESRNLWPANDALCAALQVINHLQDCAKDYKDIDRVYIPEDLLAEHGAKVEMLAEPKSPPELKRTIRHLTRLTEALLDESRPFSTLIRDPRLALEVEVIQRLAEDLARKLMRRDPLCDKVHHSKPEALLRALGAAGVFAVVRPLTRRRRFPTAQVSA